MQLELISEDEMVTKPKKVSDTKPKTDIKIIHDKDDKGTEVEKDVPPPTQKGTIGGVGPNIIKKIYFPGDTYSKKDNQTGFKKILAVYGLAWVKSMMKSYSRKDGTALLTGVYASADQNKKVFCIYEGTNKPMTAIVKIIGSGGIFLIDLNSYCHKIGCIIEDKDEMYINNVLLVLHEKGEIYVEKKMDDETLEDIHRRHEEKVEKVLNEAVEKFIEAHRFMYDTYCESLLWKRGFSENFVRKFRRMEIEKDIRWLIKSNIC